jgi:hypothetical protein
MMKHWSILILLVGCANGEMSSGEIPSFGPDASSEAGADGAPGQPDAAPGSPDADVPAAKKASHLLLTEVLLSPTGSEFVELANLTGQTVSLADVHLSDTAEYMMTPGGASPTTSDFIVRFPTGSTIADGEVIVVAIDGTGFYTAFGANADYCLSGSGCIPMLDVASGTGPTLTNAGEPIILFSWNGTADLVRDLDIVKAGVPTTANPMPDKTGISVDGPDGDSVASSYSAESATMLGPSEAPGFDLSMKRIALEDGAETMGGNGQQGEDETSENCSQTWDDAPFSAPTPGSLPASLL